jgi:manganese transport protein
LGSAVALNLLFGLPTIAGALLTSFDVLLILVLQQRGMRRLEAVVLVLLMTIGACMMVELWLAKPPLQRIAHGVVPRLSTESLYVAIGILGATVMPHNLYLHSALMPRVAKQARAQALRTSLWSTAFALNLALLVNAAILIVAAATFSERGLAVTDLREVHQLLSPLLGSGLASGMFAVGLLCAGQSATISGTLAGQIVMEGFVNIRLPPLLRRAVTRGLAIIPAIAVLAVAGDDGLMPLLIGSQIILSLQLPFAVVPLIRLTSSVAIMGRHANSRWIRWLAGICAAGIVTANVALVTRTVEQLSETTPSLACLLGLAGVASLVLLGRVCVVPLNSRSPIANVRLRSSLLASPMRL